MSDTGYDETSHPLVARVRYDTPRGTGYTRIEYARDELDVDANGTLHLPSRDDILDRVKREIAPLEITHTHYVAADINDFNEFEILSVEGYEVVTLSFCGRMRVLNTTRVEGVEASFCHSLEVVRMSDNASGSLELEDCRRVREIHGATSLQRLELSYVPESMCVYGGSFVDLKKLRLDNAIARIPHANDIACEGTPTRFAYERTRERMRTELSAQCVWLTLAWRAMTGGGKDATGLAHADLLRTAMRFL